jgi:hypothetical protein
MKPCAVCGELNGRHAEWCELCKTAVPWTFLTIAGLTLLALVLWLTTGCGVMEGFRQFDNNPTEKPATSLNEHDHFKEQW